MMSLGSQRVRSCRQAAASTLGRGVKGAKGGAVSKKSAFQGGMCCLYRDGVWLVCIVILMGIWSHLGDMRACLGGHSREAQLREEDLRWM